MNTSVSLITRLWWLGYLSYLHYLARWIPAMEYFGLFTLMFVVSGVPFIWSLVRARHDDPSLPIERVAGFAVGMLLSMLNPVTWLYSLLQIGGEIATRIRLGGNAPRPDYKQAKGYRPPFRGTWNVHRGGITPESSHSWSTIGQRYAYDFTVIDELGRTYRGKGDRPEDYYAFGEPILAPADGVVVEVKNAVRDFPSTRWGLIDLFTSDVRGNFVIIQHGPNEYSFSAHLQKGSVEARPGDHVQQGQIIGRCGNSGHSTEPHLHFHVQDHPNFLLAASTPVMFDGQFVHGGQRLTGFTAVGRAGA